MLESFPLFLFRRWRATLLKEVLQGGGFCNLEGHGTGWELVGQNEMREAAERLHENSGKLIELNSKKE